MSIGDAAFGILVLLLIASGVAIVLLSRRSGRMKREQENTARQSQELLQKYGPLVDIDAEVARLRAQRAVLEQEAQAFTATDRRRRQELDASYETAKATHDQLRREISLLEENLEDISFGLYRPHFDYQTSEAYKRQLESVRDEQKAMIKAGKAAGCAVEWHVGGSRREGERMQKQYMKILLRAFNGECDAAVAKVTWNNVTRMEERIRKSFDAINELGGVMRVSITPQYRKLKLAELRLEYEMEEKRHDEQEEQRRIKEQMRDEERAQKEAERAKQEAEAEEARYQRAYEKARLEAAKAKGEEHQRLTEKLLDLQKQLEEARSRKARATALAELTKAGYVYVVSNIGSFGENVFKIGMTRRMEPMDRVRELGGASVPFSFDVHAMVYSEDAPALEARLHRHFAKQSVNLVNMRKEFFYVTLDELEGFAESEDLKIVFTRIAEAREYRESLAMRAQQGKQEVPQRPASGSARRTSGSRTTTSAARPPAPLPQRTPNEQ